MGLIPREVKFFDLLEQQSKTVVRGAKLLQECLESKGSIDDMYLASKRIHDVEHEGDELVHSLMERLNKSFITPLDREDIHQLITRMDDILDLTEDVAQSIYLYDLRTITPEAVRLAEICVACGEQVKEAVSLLPNMDNAKKILAVCGEIDRLESEADHVMRAAMAKLFRDEPDVRQVIKLKAIYELLETVTDRCEDVANIIEGIVVENA